MDISPPPRAPMVAGKGVLGPRGKITLFRAHTRWRNPQLPPPLSVRPPKNGAVCCRLNRVLHSSCQRHGPAVTPRDPPSPTGRTITSMSLWGYSSGQHSPAADRDNWSLGCCSREEDLTRLCHKHAGAQKVPSHHPRLLSPRPPEDDLRTLDSRCCQSFVFEAFSESASYPPHSFSFLLFLRFYLFIFRERGREGEREGEKHQCVVASRAPPTGDLACNPVMCPDWESNQ